VETAKYRLDLGDERLWNGDQPVGISNKAFQLLRLFVDNPNRLLTKDDILDGVWRDVCVSEGLVKEYVHDLRLALGDDPKRPEYIETVHGRGYRFLGGVEEVNGPSGPGTQVQAAARPPSLALQPIVNLTDEERWVRFCRGLGEDLITDLARFPDLMVIATDPPAGDTAGDLLAGDNGNGIATDYVLNGSVQASDTQLRVNVKLIETRTGNHVWAERYERDLGEVFAIQSDIVGHVASAVGGFSGQIPHLERLRLGRKPPGDLEAYELYLLGHELETRFERKSALRGFELLRRAVELDPDFARAWLVLAWIAWLIVQEKWTDDIEGYRALQRDAFIQAAALDPLDPFALMELAAVRIDDGDLTGAIDALERALDLGKNQADLLIVASRYVATILDDPERAVRIMEKGLELPASVSVWHSLTIARVSYFAQDFERTVRHARLVPVTTATMTKLFEILALAQLDRREEAEDLAEAFKEEHPDFDPQDFMRDHQIAAPGAQRLFLDGIAKAGLESVQTRLQFKASGPRDTGKSSHRGHHHRTVALSLALRDRAKLVLRL
jgi:TolB-like protein